MSKATGFSTWNGECYTSESIGICPKCHEKVGDMWEVLRQGDDAHEVECDECGTKFEVTLSISHTYTSREVKEDA
jgi:uncharacterized Zn finger protein